MNHSIGLLTLITLVNCDGPPLVGPPIGPTAAVTASTLLATLSADRTDILATTTLERGRGAPRWDAVQFSVADPDGFDDVLLEVAVRSGPGGRGGTPVEVLLNGELLIDEVVRTSSWFEFPVPLAAQNELAVRVRGTPGSTVEVRVTGVPKVLRWTLLSAENQGPRNTPVSARTASTYAPELDAVFMVEYGGDFGTGELWRFDFSTRDWGLVPTTGWPIGKMRQYRYDPDANEILVAWDGLGTVWAVPATGGAWRVRQADGPRASHYTGSFFYDRTNSQYTHTFGYGVGRTCSAPQT